MAPALASTPDPARGFREPGPKGQHLVSFSNRMKIIIKTIVFIYMIGIVGLFLRAAPSKQQTWDGNRTTPLHLIPLKDEFDQLIVPTESNPLPFSSRFTCAPCHDYNLISQGLHFGAVSPTASGRPGEPWIWVEEKSGTLLPLSYQKWPGTWHPEEVGLSAWDFTLLFGRHMAGGGVAEPPASEVTPASRWNVSGKIEINCLGCHNASNKQSQTEWTKQILRQNFRWAATAAAGLGEVGGMASRLGPTWDLFDGSNPDDTEWAVPPFVRYERSLFDSKHQAFLEISGKPSDSRCLACHSVAPVAMKKYEYEPDVHTAAGLACTSCHRHDLSHAMIRGYEGEAEHSSLLAEDSFTCSGCHLGGDPARGKKKLAGRLGAPYPRHKGFPAVHFKRLTCTACHSGPWPENELTRVRTSRANRLGIYGIARWHTDLPAILQPVYIRDSRGKLGPYRLLWPAFWAERRAGKLRPLSPDEVEASAGKILHPELTAARILNALTLQLEADEKALLILAGKVYELNVDGGLSVIDISPPWPNQGLSWAYSKGEGLFPLVQDFDPTAELLDPEVEARLVKILEALAELEDRPEKPALLYRNFLFRVAETTVEKSDYSGERAEKMQFGWLVEGKFQPLIPEFEQRTISRLVGTEQTLTEEQVELVLKSLTQDKARSENDEGTDYVYISSGKMFVLSQGARLEALDDPAARPVTWPLAHEVRPARQSLGVNGCGDCHRIHSPFLFRKVRGTGPLQTMRVKVLAAGSFSGISKIYQGLFGLSFAVRPLFKGILFASVLIVGAIILLVFLLELGRLSGVLSKGREG